MRNQQVQITKQTHKTENIYIYLHMSNSNHSKERKTMWVVLLTAAAMIVEISFGLITKSMALLADGIHMGSHVLAIGLSWAAYIVVRRLERKNTFAGNSKKILSLSGYSSGLMLLIFAVFILIEALKRFFNPVEIQFKEAIIVAIAGLLINLISALILRHDHAHSDHNIKAAYLHVLADALTSITAIIALLGAMIWQIFWLDAAGAFIGSFVIIKWSTGLLKESGKVLLDIHAENTKADNF
ncbi:MAG TPA: cation diffusion facilitator family transporter [Bacteroidales bacterium]|nr:cation diffusion facilitator family transporter [Bacteroidales bacterium]